MFGLLRDEGLERFYELGGSELGAVGPVPRLPALDWLPELEAGNTVDGSVQVTLDVQGIRCAACVWLLQELFKRTPGARAIRLDASLGRATLLYRAGAGTGHAFLLRAARLGYPMAKATRRARRDDGLLLRLGITAALAMNAMILAAAQYFGLAAEGGSLDALFARVSWALATGSVLFGGPVFFRAAWHGLRAGMVHMDLPISLGLLLAYGGSVHGVLTGGAAYFDTVAIFVALMVGGRFLQQRSLQRGRDQVLADDGAEHLRARRLREGAVEVVPIASVAAGDELVLAPGDLVPVRVRLETAASCSLDWINGESEPRAFGVGDVVPAGAFVAGRRPVRGVAAADYAESGLAELLQQIPEEAADDKARGRVRFWDRLARGYSIAVLALALLGASIWWFVDPARSLQVAVAVLVVTCPCALGIAVPLSFHLSLAELRRRGVFVRSQSLLDKLVRVRKVLFDKTGTVTFGGLRARADRCVAGADQVVLATMAASSNHPASQAVLATFDGDAAFDASIRVEEEPGGGLVAVVKGAPGREYRLGSPRFCGVADRDLRECAFACDGAELARFALEEDYRAGARREIEALQVRGMDVYLLSGDRPARVAAAAGLLGIAPARAFGALSPQEKARRVAALDDGDTLMVGDGLNDAPAFAAAFCAATPAMDRPVLPGRADFFYRGANAGAVELALAVADRRRAVVRANLALALLYNSAALTLCFLGVMTPLICAISMPLSSLALIAHTTLRIGRGRGEGASR